jgi:arylsulfatase A-like enzyme
VLISLDTVRPDHLGCYGYGRNTSPNLDAFARQGVRFSQARCQMPYTLPSHMALFTSMLPSHNTVDHYEALLPKEVPTLAELLQAHGYKTAALVNDGQMTSRWGFHRGFGLWREFQESQPEGDCEHLTAAALAWLESRPAEPFFLFLHYYDPHSPYDPPAPYREAFGSSLTGAEADRVCWHVRRPENPLTNRDLFDQAIGSYDGEIAWLDHELGKLFEHLADNTLVVVFSDHGEAFKEHGWWMHSATLYEEEVRSALVLRHKGLVPEGRAVDEPVMLLDVAPTILNLCGIQSPTHFEGTDLSPLWQEGGRLPDRFMLSELKTQLDSRVLRMAQLGEWKLIYSLLNGKRELYRLPDEQTDRSREEPVMLQILFGAIQTGLEQDDYWVLYAHGHGDFTATLKPIKGHFGLTFVFDDLSQEQTPQSLKPKSPPDRRWVQWKYSPEGKTRGLYFELSPRETALNVDLQINGRRVPEKVFLGAAGAHPQKIPWDTKLADSLSSPVIEAPFQPAAEGFYLRHHRGKRSVSARSRVTPLDEKTLKKLRSLGYLR